MFVRLTNDTTYLTGHEGQKIRAVFSENAALQSYSATSIVQILMPVGHFTLRITHMRIIFDHVVGNGHFVSRLVIRRSPVFRELLFLSCLRVFRFTTTLAKLN